MEKRKIISVAGDLASGKGTVTEILKEILGFEIYRNGDYFRKLAKDNNMSVTEFNEYVKGHPEIDNQIEESAREYAKEHDKLLIDARLGWYVVPESFKVYMKVDIDESAKRAFNDAKRKSTECFDTVEEQKEDIIKRSALERDRYYNLYGVDKMDMSNYDFVIDTTTLTPEKVADIIIEQYEAWLDNEE